MLTDFILSIFSINLGYNSEELPNNNISISFLKYFWSSDSFPIKEIPPQIGKNLSSPKLINRKKTRRMAVSIWSYIGLLPCEKAIVV